MIFTTEETLSVVILIVTLNKFNLICSFLGFSRKCKFLTVRLFGLHTHSLSLLLIHTLKESLILVSEMLEISLIVVYFLQQLLLFLDLGLKVVRLKQGHWKTFSTNLLQLTHKWVYVLYLLRHRVLELHLRLQKLNRDWLLSWLLSRLLLLTQLCVIYNISITLPTPPVLFSWKVI